MPIPYDRTRALGRAEGLMRDTGCGIRDEKQQPMQDSGCKDARGRSEFLILHPGSCIRVSAVIPHPVSGIGVLASRIVGFPLTPQTAFAIVTAVHPKENP
jgi:hypothetical protein